MKRIYGRIYGLHDPETGELRYIGQTRMSLQRRLQFHCAPSMLRGSDHKTHWILALKAKGLRPEIRWRVDASDQGDLNRLEIEHIAAAKAEGVRLTNTGPGGDSLGGEHYQRLAKMKRGVPRTPEERAKISAARKGQPSPMKGKEHSGETKAQISESRKGKSTGASHHQYNHDLTPEAVADHIRENHCTKTDAANYFGVSRAFINRRLDEARELGLVVPDLSFRTSWNAGKTLSKTHVERATAARTYHKGADRHMHRDIDLDAVVARLKAGEQQKDVAAELGITAKTLRAKLKAAGKPVPRKSIEIDLAAVQARLAAGEMQKDIAVDLGVSQALLSQRLRAA